MLIITHSPVEMQACDGLFENHPRRLRRINANKAKYKEGAALNKKNPLYRLKAPCGKCPYKLGLVRTIVNPCPQCKADNYRTYERFVSYGMKTRKTDES